MSTKHAIAASLDVQADGVTVSLCVSLPNPAASAPSFAGLTAESEDAATAAPDLAQAALRSVVAAAPALREVHRQTLAIVLASQCSLLAQQVDELRTGQSSEGGAA